MRLPLPGQRPGAVAAGIVAVLLLLGLGQLVGLYSGIETALVELRQAQDDNKTYLVAEGEVDLLKYRLALIHARIKPTPHTLDEARRSFDILFSRVQVIEKAIHAGPVLAKDELETAWNRVVALVQRQAMIWDAGDRAVRNTLPLLEAEAQAATTPTRTFIVQAHQEIVSASMEQREGMRHLLERFVGTGAIMLALLLLLAFGMRLVLGRLERQASAKARLSSQLASVINASLDAVLITDVDGRIQESNAAAERLFGQSRAALSGQNLDRMFAPGSPGRASRVGDLPTRTWLALAATGRQVRSSVLRRDGQALPVEVVFAQDADVAGEQSFIVFIRDISDHVAIERSLETARDAAVRGEAAKSRFLAVMSHEMRTPLNGLIAALDILNETTRLSQRQAKFLSIARQCGATTLEQIDDVLELTRLDGKSPPEEAEDFDLCALLRTLVEQNRPMAALRATTLTLSTPSTTLPWVRGPRRSLSRVVLNLLGNAIKFTQAGQIDLTLVQDAADADGLRLRLSVRDTGTGIAPDKLDLIFRDFETAEPNGQRFAEGTGLGLGIVRRAMDRMGGSVHVESALGKGSTFTVAFPLALGVNPAAPQGEGKLATDSQSAHRPVALGLSVLIAEDNQINRLVLVEMLNHLGARVDQATDGQEAVRLAAQKRYDLIVMDLSMPIMDGIEATTRIRESGASAASHIVGLTAHSLDDPLNRMRAAGMTRVLTKPLTLEALRSLVADAKPMEPGEFPPEATGMFDPAPLLDLSQSLPPAALTSLVARFLDEGGEMLATLALPDPDPDLAHRLAGSAALFGAKGLRSLAQAAENSLHARGHLTKDDLSDLAVAWRETRAALNAWQQAQP